MLISPLVLQEEEAFDSYVLISQQDALEAMGCFVAAYLATLPDAQKMEPQELQKALVNSFKVSWQPFYLQSLGLWCMKATGSMSDPIKASCTSAAGLPEPLLAVCVCIHRSQLLPEAAP